MNQLRRLTAKDFLITEEDLRKTAAAMDEEAFGPRPYGTFNSLTILCTICQQPMNDITAHKCAVLIACSRCGDLHPMTMTGCY